MTHELADLAGRTGFADIPWQAPVMWVVVAALLYLVLWRGRSPLVMVPLALGALVANLPMGDGWANVAAILELRGWGDAGGGWYALLPLLVLLGTGLSLDFGPLLAAPRAFVLGAAAQAGVFLVFLIAVEVGFSPREAAVVGMTGGADVAMTLLLGVKLAPNMAGAAAASALLWVVLAPLIPPVLAGWLTTPAERSIRMPALREVSPREKQVFALVLLVAIALLFPAVTWPAVMLLLGNFVRECGALGPLPAAFAGAIRTGITVLLGAGVGLLLGGGNVLTWGSLAVLVLGGAGLVVATIAGVLAAKVLNRLMPRDPLNPLVGAAAAGPLLTAVQCAETAGLESDATNHLLPHALGAGLASLIGTVLVAGYFLTRLG